MMGLDDVLTEAGYDVVGAADASSALKILDLDNSTIQCVVTDIRLPGKLNGWDIARRARELVPSMPIIYTSGDSAIEWGARGVPESLMLQKPYAMSQVVTGVARLITERTSKTPK